MFLVHYAQVLQDRQAQQVGQNLHHVIRLLIHIVGELIGDLAIAVVEKRELFTVEDQKE